MSVNYFCRHCGTSLGRIDHAHVNEMQLGFHSLTPEERSDIISYNSNGDVTVRVTCDYCKEALDTHPELMLLSNPLQ